MIIDKEKKTVTFEISEEDINVLEFIANMRRLTGDELFQDFLRRNMELETRRYAFENSRMRNESFLSRSSYGRDELSQEELDDRTRMRIDRWARTPSTVSHKIIKAFFSIKDEKGKVTKEDMWKAFEKFEDGEDLEMRFIMNFRHLCSVAGGSYGKIFDINRSTKEVTLNPVFKDQVEGLKEYYMM